MCVTWSVMGKQSRQAKIVHITCFCQLVVRYLTTMDVSNLKSIVDRLSRWSQDWQSMVKCKSAVSSFFLFHLECKTMCSCLLVLAGKRTKTLRQYFASLQCQVLWLDEIWELVTWWMNDKTSEVPWPEHIQFYLLWIKSYTPNTSTI